MSTVEEEDDFFTQLEREMVALDRPPPSPPSPPSPPPRSTAPPAPLYEVNVFRHSSTNFYPVGDYNEHCQVALRDERWFQTEQELRRLPSIEAVQAELPPHDWSCEMLQWFDRLPVETQWELQDYMGRGFQHMNHQLRQRPTRVATFNLALRSAPVLPRSMVVYRYTDETYELGVTTLTGYTSTSYYAYLVYTAGFNRSVIPSVMRITLPAGFKAIYTTSHEWEIVLPHATSVEVRAKEVIAGRVVYDCVALDWRR
jgi:hypothetical protein